MSAKPSSLYFPFLISAFTLRQVSTFTVVGVMVKTFALEQVLKMDVLGSNQ